MGFYVQNSNGKDSLDLWSCSHGLKREGEGEGRPTASYHIYMKNRPFIPSSYITVFKILSTATLDENHRILKKNHTYLRKNSLRTTALYLQCCD